MNCHNFEEEEVDTNCHDVNINVIMYYKFLTVMFFLKLVLAGVSLIVIHMQIFKYTPCFSNISSEPISFLITLG